jgi:hypothetical protein
VVTENYGRDEAGTMGFDFHYDHVRNASQDYFKSKSDTSEFYRYTDPTILQEFTGTGTFDIEFGSFGVWDSTISYHEHTCPWPITSLCYDPPILDNGCFPRLASSASLQWAITADVTYVYDPFTVSMHGPASAQANGPYSGTVGTPIWFSADGSIGYPFQVVLYSWDWGDGGVTTTTDSYVQHVYSQPYQGVVWLTITDQEGSQASDSASVSVTSPWAPGDIDHDGDVDSVDISIIQSFLNMSASKCPSCDLDGDGTITALDTRKAVLLCTRPRCATQ